MKSVVISFEGTGMQKIACEAGMKFVFDGFVGEAEFTRDGSDLVVSKNGSHIVLTGFYDVYSGDEQPDFEIDGVDIASADFFEAMDAADLEPAAGPGGGQPAPSAVAGGGRYSAYSDMALLDGITNLGPFDIGLSGEPPLLEYLASAGRWLGDGLESAIPEQPAGVQADADAAALDGGDEGMASAPVQNGELLEYTPSYRLLSNANRNDDNDFITGSQNNDIINGNEEDNYIFGETGNDTIYGDNGDDTIYGDNGDDTIYGGAGDDFVDGGNDQDILFGEAGNDILVFDANNIFMDGGSDIDFLIGKSGSGTIDAFLNSQGTENDTVKDVEVAIETDLSLSNIEELTKKLHISITDENKISQPDSTDGWDDGVSSVHNDTEFMTFTHTDEDNVEDATLVVAKTMLESGV